ncbi:MAG: response regulator transcription factor [Bacteroidetes bacterium]|nr:response regulator transcription factor [Bacteroidota bacterium]
MNCILLEDNDNDRAIVEQYISKIPFLRLNNSFANAEDGIQYLASNKIDLVISDIEMPGLNGFQFLEVITEKPLVVFQTTHLDLAAEGFNVNAVDFLVKPFEFERFYRAMNKAYGIHQKSQSLSPEESYFYIKNRESLVKIETKNITYIEAEENYCYIHLLNGEKHIVIISLKKAEEQLGPSFARVSRNNLVNMDYCVKINSDSLQLQTGEHVTLGNSFKKGLEEAFVKNKIWQR